MHLFKHQFSEDMQLRGHAFIIRLSTCHFFFHPKLHKITKISRCLIDFLGKLHISFPWAAATDLCAERRNVVVNGFDLGEALLEDQIFMTKLAIFY
jgi:hypothetical protein